MSFDLERQQIEAHYKANAIAGVEFAYDGFDLNLINPISNVSNLPAISLTILTGEAVQASIGVPDSNISRNAGIAIFQIYTEGGKGSVEANGLLDQIADMYRNEKLGTIRCKIPYPRNPDPEEPYYKLNVVVPYERDEFNA